MIPTLSVTVPEQEALVSRVHELIATSVPWLSRINHTFPVFSAGQAQSHYTDDHGNIYIDFGVDYLDVDTLGEPRVVANLATTLVACAWKILRNHDSRSTSFAVTDAENWQQASSAVCCRDAVQTPVTGYADRHTRYLPRPEGMVTVNALSSVLPGITDPETITTEDLYLLLEKESRKRGGNGTASGLQPSIRPLPAGAIPPPEASDRGELEMDSVRSDVAQSIASERSRGTDLPDSVEEWAATENAKAHLSLEERFRSVVGSVVDSSVAGSRHTYRRPPRIDDSHFLFPGRAGSVRRMIIGIDVSGSRSDDELTQDFAEVAAAAESRGFDISYFSVSTVAHGVRKAVSGQPPVFDRDAAGTDMRMAFTLFDEGNWDVAVLLTDGLTPWPTTPPRCRETLVAISHPEAGVPKDILDTAVSAMPWATVVPLPVRQG